MKPILKSRFPIFSLGGAVILFCSYILCVNVNADDFANIGSGSPGLRTVTRPRNSNAIVIYRGLPEMPFGDFMGYNVATNETIQVIIDHGYHFQKAEMLSLTNDIGVPLQLYPFASNSAFTDETGVEWSWPSSNDWAIFSSGAVGYTLTNSVLNNG